MNALAGSAGASIGGTTTVESGGRADAGGSPGVAGTGGAFGGGGTAAGVGGAAGAQPGGGRGGASAGPSGAGAAGDTSGAGAANCSGVLCEDFESGHVDSTKWDLVASGGTITVQADRAAHGKYAAKVHGVTGSSDDWAILVAKSVPSALKGTTTFGRMYAYVSPEAVASIHVQMAFAGRNGTGTTSGPAPFTKLRYMEIERQSVELVPLPTPEEMSKLAFDLDARLRSDTHRGREEARACRSRPSWTTGAPDSVSEPRVEVVSEERATARVQACWRHCLPALRG